MRALQFWKAVTMDRSDFLERLLAALEAAKIKFCVIGGVAVNAYAEPLITLDLDVAVALEDVERAKNVLSSVAPERSRLRVQIHDDSRCAAFVKRAQRREVLGLQLPVAAL